MRCENCDSDTAHEVQGYVAHSVLLGDIRLGHITSRRCDECEEVFLDIANWDLVFQSIKDRESRAIGRIPSDQFVSAKKASVMLGISKQAFSKDPRIKDGFIIQRIVDDEDRKALYYIPSIKKYGIDRDGRMKLNEPSGDGVNRVTYSLSQDATNVRTVDGASNVIDLNQERLARDAA